MYLYVHILTDTHTHVRARAHTHTKRYNLEYYKIYTKHEVLILLLFNIFFMHSMFTVFSITIYRNYG